MPTTPVYAIPYPGLSDQPHGPNQMQALALEVENELVRIDNELVRIDAQPQFLAAAASANVDLGTVEVDITGATVTVTTTKPNARYLCTGSFYFAMIAASNGVALGKLSVDGVVQPAFANFTGLFSTPERANVAQTWSGILAAAGVHTLKLRGLGTVASPGQAQRVNATHTTITALVFE